MPRLIPILAFTASTACIIATPLIFSHYPVSVALLVLAVLALWLGHIIARRSSDSPRWLKRFSGFLAVGATFMLLAPVAGLFWLSGWIILLGLGFLLLCTASLVYNALHAALPRPSDPAQRMSHDEWRVVGMIVVIAVVAFSLFNIMTFIYAGDPDSMLHDQVMGLYSSESEQGDPDRDQ